MSRPYMAPEKIPEIYLTEHDNDVDLETQGEQGSLLYRPIYGEIKYKNAEPHKKIIIVVIALLLTSVVATIGALKMRCGVEFTADAIRHAESLSGISKRIVIPTGWSAKGDDLTEEEDRAIDITKRIVIPPSWKEKSDDSNLFEGDFTFKRPHGWAGNVPSTGIDKRDQDSAWKRPKGWKPINNVDKRSTTRVPWKTPRGWKGHIESITRRGIWTRPGSAGFTGSTENSAASTTAGAVDSLSTAINASITVPLYSYPGDGAKDWAPVFRALNSSSNTKFTIIINPDNGPGKGDPDANFQTGIKKLKSFPNAEVFGYVHQSYGKRPVTEVQADLLAYAAWNASKIGISIDGIFFDESPNDAVNAPFVATVNTFAKAQGLSTTIQNAGTVPSREYFAPTQNTDITVVLEDSFDDYSAIASKYDDLAAKNGVSKGAFSFIIYEAPTDSQSIRSAVLKMTKQVGHVFMSDLTQEEVYTNISSEHFTTFIAAMIKAFSS